MAPVIIAIGLLLTSCKPFSYQLTDDERKTLIAEAELVFVGTLSGIEKVSGYDTVNAMEHQSDISYIVTFNVTKVEKGYFPDKKYVMAIRSPAASFLIYPLDLGKAASKDYRVFIKRASDGRAVIKGERIEEKS